MPTWIIFGAIYAVFCVIYLAVSGIRNRKESAFLHAVFDGDRLQRYRSERSQKCRRIGTVTMLKSAHSGPRFY